MGRLISRFATQFSGASLLPFQGSRKLRATPFVIILLAALTLLPGHLQTPAAAPRTQTSQSPLERDLAAGDLHSYRVTLADGQLVSALVDQRGIDVVVTLYGPDNRRLTEVDHPVGAWGPEPLFFEVKQSGSYQIEVRPRQTSPPPGRYRFSYETRGAALEDSRRLRANRAFAEAARLVKIETPRSFQLAMERYEEARRLFREAQDRRGETLALTIMGAISAARGDAQKALGYFNEALPLLRSAGSNMRGEEAMTLSRIGQVYQSMGDRQKALDHFDQAFQLFDAIDDNRTAGYTLVNAGAVHDSMGESQKALDSFNEALPFFERARDRRSEAYTLNNMGLVYDALGDKERAREAYARALALFEEINDCGEVAPTLSNLASDLLDAGDKLKALDYLNQALILQRGNNDRKGEATTLNNIGVVYNALGQTPKGLDHLRQALAIHREVKNRPGEGDALSNMMFGWKSMARPEVAVFYGKAAVNAYQEVRAQIPPLDKEAQKSFIKSKEGTYRELADLLVARGRLPEAQQVLGLLKEEEYFQFVRRDGADAANLTAPASLTPEEQDLADRYREISDRLATLGRQRAELLGKANRAPDEQRLLLKLEADLGVANLEFQKFIDRISNELAATTKQGGERVEQLKNTQHIVNILRELGAGSVALYTFVGEQRYSIILVTPEVQIAREYSIRASELYAKALAFREALEDPRRDARPLAQELYRILIAPIANDLRETRAETLMWSLDGILRYVPVAALHDGEKYMVERYRNTVFTPISTTRLTDQPSARWESLGFGVSKAQPGFQPLAEVPQELRGIIREENAGQVGTGVLPGKIRLDESFTKDEMDAALAQQKYAVVHIASHFKFEPGNETNSFLLLGDGARLTLDQLRNSADYFRGVDLLTLSACNTATAGAGADGKEVEGFAVLAQHQGAEAVIASLWPVADASTGLLMQRFYQIRSSRPAIPKAEALREAQMSLLHGEVKAPDGKDYSHPNFWAPFILIGNWR